MEELKQETIERDEAAEMRALALRYAQDLESEAEFDPDYAFRTWDDGEATLDELVPDDVRNLIDEEGFQQDPQIAIVDAFEAWEESATDNVLDVRGSVSFGYGGDGMTLQTLTVVLATGGPHVEVTFNDDGRGHVTAYGWFGAHRVEIPVTFPGHPIAALFGLYAGMFE